MAHEWSYTKSSLKHQLWLVFDTGLGVTPHMGHLGYLSSHWSVLVHNNYAHIGYILIINAIRKTLQAEEYTRLTLSPTL